MDRESSHGVTEGQTQRSTHIQARTPAPGEAKARGDRPKETRDPFQETRETKIQKGIPGATPGPQNPSSARTE